MLLDVASFLLCIKTADGVVTSLIKCSITALMKAKVFLTYSNNQPGVLRLSVRV